MTASGNKPTTTTGTWCGATRSRSTGCSRRRVSYPGWKLITSAAGMNCAGKTCSIRTWNASSEIFKSKTISNNLMSMTSYRQHISSPASTLSSTSNSSVTKTSLNACGLWNLYLSFYYQRHPNARARVFLSSRTSAISLSGKQPRGIQAYKATYVKSICLIRYCSEVVSLICVSMRCVLTTSPWLFICIALDLPGLHTIGMTMAILRIYVLFLFYNNR